MRNTIRVGDSLPIEITSHLVTRFWRRVDKNGPIHAVHGQCWQWTAGKRAGYGRIQHLRKSLSAHRVSWVIVGESIPDRLKVLHKCDNPGCVRPSHLFVGTSKANSADMAAKGRSSRGGKHYCSKLTTRDVKEIRRTCATQASLARQFRVTKQTISNIIKRDTWKHI